ncbi:hypothetical protein [Thiomonas sp.]
MPPRDAIPRILPFSHSETPKADQIEREAAAWLHRFEPRVFQNFPEFQAVDPWDSPAEARRAGGQLGVAQAPWRRYSLDMAATPVITEKALLLMVADTRPWVHLALVQGLASGRLTHTTVELRTHRVVLMWDLAGLSRKHRQKGAAIGVAFDFPDLREKLEARFPVEPFEITILLPVTRRGWEGCVHQQPEYLENLGELPHYIVPTGPRALVT